LNHKLRIKVEWDPRNLTAVHPLHAIIFYIVPPTPRLPHRAFVATGFWLQRLDSLFLIFSPDPMVQVQTSLLKELRALRDPNATHAHLQGLVENVFVRRSPEEIVTYLLRRSCTNGSQSCWLNGTQFRNNHSVILALQQYDFVEYQGHWRSMLALCGVAVALMMFAAIHERPRWSDIAPHSVVFCMTGDYAAILLFYGRRDDFDIGDTYGFAFVGLCALWMPVCSLSRRLNASNRAYERLVGRPFDLSWFKWVIILGCLMGFTSVPLLAFVARFSYWVPQILFAAALNNRRTVNVCYAATLSAGQLLFTGVILAYNPIFQNDGELIMKVLVVWVSVQLAVMLLQNLFGGGFFIPGQYRSARFDWHSEPPPPDAECPVCLAEIGEGEQWLLTPCRHFFHDHCLRRWMEEQPICPICRHPLPAIDLESTAV
jgi:hypothetical protein